MHLFVHSFLHKDIDRKWGILQDFCFRVIHGIWITVIASSLSLLTFLFLTVFNNQ